MIKLSITPETVSFVFPALTPENAAVFQSTLPQFVARLKYPLLGPASALTSGGLVSVSASVLSTGNLALAGISDFCLSLLKEFNPSFRDPKTSVRSVFYSTFNISVGLIRHSYFISLSNTSPAVVASLSATINSFIDAFIPKYVLTSRSVSFDSVSGRVGVSLELLSGKGFDRLTVLTQAFETLI